MHFTFLQLEQQSLELFLISNRWNLSWTTRTFHGFWWQRSLGAEPPKYTYIIYAISRLIFFSFVNFLEINCMVKFNRKYLIYSDRQNQKNLRYLFYLNNRFKKEILTESLRWLSVYIHWIICSCYIFPFS